MLNPALEISVTLRAIDDPPHCTFKRRPMSKVCGLRHYGQRTSSAVSSLPRRELYTLRHTCLTRWAPHMNRWALALRASAGADHPRGDGSCEGSRVGILLGITRKN